MSRKKLVLFILLFFFVTACMLASMIRQFAITIELKPEVAIHQGKTLLVNQPAMREEPTMLSLFVQSDSDALWIAPFLDQSVTIVYESGQEDTISVEKPGLSHFLQQLLAHTSLSRSPFAGKILYEDESFSSRMDIPIDTDEQVKTVTLRLLNPTEINLDVKNNTDEQLTLWARPKYHHDAMLTSTIHGQTSFLAGINKSISYYVQISGSLLLRNLFGTFVLLFFIVLLAKVLQVLPSFTLPPHVLTKLQTIALYVLPMVVFLVTTVIAVSYFEKVPHSQDEVAYLFQAKTFARGYMFTTAPPGELHRFFDHEFIVINDTDGKWFGKYPPGTSVLFALGLLASAPFLVNPLIAAGNIVLFILIARKFLPRHLALIAALLFATSPFFLLVSASYFSHPSAMFFTLLAFFACLGIIRKPQQPLPWLLFGLSIGLLSLIRPANALSLGIVLLLPIFLKIPRHFKRMVGGLALLLIFIGLHLFYNYLLTGNALLPPYSLYSTYDTLGFGFRGIEFGGSFTVKDAFANLVFNTSSLLDMLFRWPQFLTLALLPIAFFGPFRKGSIYLAIVFLSQVVLYFFYFSEGTFLGPRYWFEVVWIIPLMLGMALGTLPLLFPSLKRISTALYLIITLFLVVTAANFLAILPLFKGLNGIQPTSTPTVETPAVIFIPEPRGSWITYSRYFIRQDGFLDAPVIFARNQAVHNLATNEPPLENVALYSVFPERNFYLLEGNTLSKL